MQLDCRIIGGRRGQPRERVGSAAVFGLGLGFFHWMASRGVRRLEWLNEQGLVPPQG